MKEIVYNRLKDILEQNDNPEDIIEMIDKEFCIKLIPYFEKRMY